MVALLEEVETRIRQTTHDRIRDLNVKEEHGWVVIRGRAETYYAKQLALHGALELLPGNRLRAEITVG